MMNPEDETNVPEETPAEESGINETPEAPVNETPAEEASAEPEVKSEPAGSSSDSSYHYTKPSSFTDANYIPQDEAPKAPRSYTYTEPEIRENRATQERAAAAAAKEQKKAKQKSGISIASVIALCLAFLILGSSVGFFASGVRMRNSANEESKALEDVTVTDAEEAEASEEATEEAAAESTPAASTVTASAATESTNGVMDATEIYEMACRQVVGISTEVTYQSYYGTASGTVTGTGIVISEDGYILTNFHVVEYATEGNPITVLFYNGDSYEATLVGYEDEDNDIAVLKIDATGLDAATLGDSDSMQVGETIYAVGNPLGELDYTMTKGMVSAMDRQISTSDSDSAINMFQIDAAVNSGNSGGPVYNERGQVIGIVTAKYGDSYQEMGIEGLGFAIPINDAKSIANDLIESGYVRGKAYMGISGKTVSSSTAQYYNMVEGAYVYGIVDGSCAQAAGLNQGDIITGVDSYEVKSISDLQSALKNYSAGDTATLTVFRNNETITLTITFDEKQPDTDTGTGTTQTAPSQPNGIPGYNSSNTYGGYGYFGSQSYT